MIRLTYPSTDVLSLITAQNGAKVVVSYSDATSSAYTGNTQVTSIASATTTTIASTPAASTVRDIDEINIKNTYAGSHTMTVQFDRGGGTLYPMFTAALLQDESISYTHGSGWCALDANGNRKEVTGSLFSSLTVTGAVTEPKRGAAYQWSTWNPSDVAGTNTNGPSTAVATSTATTYISSMSNSSGTVTWNFAKAGVFLVTAAVTLDSQAAVFDDGYTRWTIGGTSTRLLTATSMPFTAASGRTSTQTQTFLVSSSGSDTLTLLPAISVTKAAGTTTNYIGSANAVVTYIGAS